MKVIQNIVRELEAKGILENIIRVPNFPDEPQGYWYRAILRRSPDVYGFSLNSPMSALTRCLTTALELGESGNRRKKATLEIIRNRRTTGNRINLSSMRSKKVKTTLQKINRYRLEIILFHKTAGVKISVFTAIIKDRTGLGPAVSRGVSINPNTIAAILESIDDALLMRNLRRRELYEKK